MQFNVENGVPQEQCLKCSKMIAVTELREHLDTCEDKYVCFFAVKNVTVIIMFSKYCVQARRAYGPFSGC